MVRGKVRNAWDRFNEKPTVIPTTQAREDTDYSFSQLKDYTVKARWLRDKGFWIIIGIILVVFLIHRLAPPNFP